MIMSRTRPVIRRISQAATRPLPSAVGTSRWETTPLSVPASIARAWLWACGGKKSMMRLTDSAASTVWIVESTRWPVSAAESAVWTVSSSRISPMRITSGSWRSTRRRARLNDAVSSPTSRWLMIERLSSWRYSIGSSIVTMCFDAGPVDLVDHRGKGGGLARAGGPGQQDDPALLLGQLGDDRRQQQLLDRADAEGNRATDDRDGAALAERVDAEARQPGQRVGEVDLVLGAELVQLGLVVEHLLQRALRVARREGLVPSIGARAPCTRTIGGEPTFRWRSDPSRSNR